MLSGISTDSSRSSSSEELSEMMWSTFSLTSLGLSRRSRSLSRCETWDGGIVANQYRQVTYRALSMGSAMLKSM
jgi:hypothetical protein